MVYWHMGLDGPNVYDVVADCDCDVCVIHWSNPLYFLHCELGEA